MADDKITQIAEQVSTLMQLDRMRYHVGTEIDMKALANVPAYIASVFENANAVSPGLSPAEYYDLVNKRVSDIQAQLYLMRLELENRHACDPAKIYADPMQISAYGEHLETQTKLAKKFGFGPNVLAHGWHHVERNEEGVEHRWMRPGDVSVACVPHLGTVDQTLVITGYVLHADQREGLVIRAGGQQATIDFVEDANVSRFKATLALTAEAAKSANYVPVEFSMSVFREPNELDARLLGANISLFECIPSALDTA